MGSRNYTGISGISDVTLEHCVAPEWLEGKRGPICCRLHPSLMTSCVETPGRKLTLLWDSQAVARCKGKTLNRWWSQLSVKHHLLNATWRKSSRGNRNTEPPRRLPDHITILNTNTQSWKPIELLKDTAELPTSYNDTGTGKFHSFKAAGDKAAPQHWESCTSCFSSLLLWVHKRDGMRKQ